MKRIILLIFVVIASVLGAYWFVASRPQMDEQISCTQEAKLCPNGSAVGRTGPNCEFAACPKVFGGDDNQGILPYKSGVSGVVTRGPVCPVMREGDNSCADQPFETEVYLYRASSSEILATARSGKDGTFQFNIPPGDYTIDAKNDGISKTCSPVSVSIGPDEIESVIISCDTGIR